MNELPELTFREKQVLNWIKLGKTNREIGAVLGICEKTVKAHVTKVFKALGVTNRTQAAIWTPSP